MGVQHSMSSGVRTATRVYLLGSVLLATALVLVLRAHLPGMGVLAAWLMAINVVALLVYCLDKLLATRQAVRVPEALLYALALAGGAVGAWLGMTLARHKTSKRSFQVTLVSLLLLEGLLIGAWLFGAFARWGLPSPWA